MAEIKHGTISVQLPDHLTPPAQAGKLSAKEVKQLPKPRRGVGQLCIKAADAIERVGDAFTPPTGVTPQSLREAGGRADDIDQILVDLKVILARLQQANLLFDAEAWRQVRQVNDQIRAQAKHDPALTVAFQQVLAGFARSSRVKKAPPTPVEEPPPA